MLMIFISLSYPSRKNNWGISYKSVALRTRSASLSPKQITPCCLVQTSSKKATRRSRFPCLCEKIGQNNYAMSYAAENKNAGVAMLSRSGVGLCGVDGFAWASPQPSR
jgi:hypothetical protein